MGSSGVGRSPGLIGRDRELSLVVDHLLDGGSVFVSGEAGIGKTVLLYEVGRLLTGRQCDVISMSGHEASSMIPLAPLLRLCPPGAEDAGAAIIAELYRRAGQGRVVVSVDDAHLLDEATGAVVRQIASADDIGLLVAVRSGEPVPPQVESIAADSVGAVIELGPFDRETTLQLVDQTLGPVDSSTGEWLWRQSQGHPLYLRELVIAGRDTGALRFEGNAWRAVEGPVWSARLHALIARRLSELEPGERELVEAVALAGDLSLEVAGRLGSVDDIAVLEERQIVSLSDGVVKVQHPLFAESVLAGIDPIRADELRMAVARAIEESTEPDPVRSLALRLEAGDEVSSDELSFGLEVALGLRLPEVAERFARFGLESGDQTAAGGLAAALGMQRRWDEAETAFGRALSAVGPNDQPDVWRRWVALNFEHRDDLQQAMQVAEEARDALGERTPVDVELALLRPGLFIGDLEVSVAEHERLRSRHELEDSEALAVDVGIATAGSHLGTFDQASTVVQTWLRASGLDPVEMMRARCFDVVSKAWLRGLRSTRDDLDDLLVDAERIGMPDLVGMARAFTGITLSDMQRPGEAVSHFREAFAMTPYLLHRPGLALAASELARVLTSIEGGAAEAQKMVDAVMDLPAPARVLPEAMAWLAQARIDRLGSIDPHPALQRGLEVARARNSRVHEVFLLREAAYLGNGADVADAARQVVSAMDGLVAALFADEIESLASSDAVSLDRVSAEAEALGVDGVAFDAAAVAVGLHEAAGDTAAALAAEWRARRILEGMPGYVSAAREQMSPVLSDREYEVVQRVVAGDSSRDAAEALFISPRTVDSHLRRVYRRLGVSGRDELAAIVGATKPSANPV